MLRGDLWAVGGQDYNILRSCERFRIATHTWVRGPDMATARSDLGVGVINRKVWVTGGMDSVGRTLSSCEHLDAVTSTWIAGPDMTKPHEGHHVVVLRGELWVVAPGDGSTERIDAVANRWVRAPDHTLTRTRFAVAVFRGQLWAVGGRRGSEGIASCEFLDVASNTWMAGAPHDHSPSLAQPCCAGWGAVGVNGGEHLKSC